MKTMPSTDGWQARSDECLPDGRPRRRAASGHFDAQAPSSARLWGGPAPVQSRGYSQCRWRVALMPYAPLPACAEPRCPGRAVYRGRCERHRPLTTTTARGYGATHQRERAAALPGAKCEACGCTRNLQRDHRIPTTLGGSEHPSNKRWLCRCPEHGCHDRVGMRRDTPVGGGQTTGRLLSLADPGAASLARPGFAVYVTRGGPGPMTTRALRRVGGLGLG